MKSKCKIKRKRTNGVIQEVKGRLPEEAKMI